MKTVFLCGGRGNRFNEKTHDIPKVLINVGDEPIIFHLMNIYAKHGFNDFLLCLGYQGESVREWFRQNTNLTKKFNVQCVFTGDEEVLKSDRILQVKEYVNDDNFFLSYGDDLSDVDMKSLLSFHLEHGKIGTVTGVHPTSQFGLMAIDHASNVKNFVEKPVLLDRFSNAGFYVFHRSVFDVLNRNYEFEDQTLPELAATNQLKMYFHDGNWDAMNNYKDWVKLNTLNSKGQAYWK